MSVKRSNEPLTSLVPVTKKTKNEIVAYAAKAKRVNILTIKKSIIQILHSLAYFYRQKLELHLYSLR